MRETLALTTTGIRRLLCLYLPVCGWLSLAVAGEGPIRDLGASEIVGADEFAAASNRSSSYEEISPEAWEGRGISAAELLSTLTGVEAHSQGGVGSFQTISIRGIAGQDILICVNGVPLNDGSGGAVDLGRIDLNQVKKIEVYKDRVPVKFGGLGVGGAVNFITKSAKVSNQESSGKFLAAYGSHNYWETATQINSAITDSVGFTAAVSARHSDNDYEFRSENGTPYNKDDDFTANRENADFTEYSGSAELRILHGNGAFSTLAFNGAYAEGGNPGRGEFQTKVAGYEGENATLSYRLESPEVLGWLWLTAGLSGRFEKNVSHSYYPLDHIGYFSTEYLEYGAAGYHLQPEITAEYLGERLAATLRIAGGFDRMEARGTSREWALERYSGNAAGEVNFHITRWLATSGEASLQLLQDDIDGGKFVLPTATQKLKTASSRDASYSYRGAILLTQPAGYFGGHISLGRFYRQPQLMELYGVYPGVVSNPDLKEETALRFESGLFVSTQKKVSTLRATYYETAVDNGIYWVTSGAFMKALNVGEVRIRGLELNLESRPAKFLQVLMGATIQEALDHTDDATYRDKNLPGEPVQSYYTEAKLQLPFHFDFTWASSYRTKIYEDRGNRLEQPAVPNHRAALGFTPYAQTRFVFAVENITDETYRNAYSPFPMPGREYRLTFTQGF